MPTQEAIPKQWLNVEEIAEYLGLKPSTIYLYINERRIPFYRISRSNQVRFSMSDIDDWIRAGKVETQEEYLERISKKKGTSDGPAQEAPG